MLQLAEELGINATLNMTVPSIKIAITNSEGYEEEFVENLYETIIANGKRLELERAEKMRLEELERAEKMRLEELERAEKMRLEELERAEKMRLEELERAEKMRLEELERAEKMRLEELERAEKMRLEELERAEKMRLEELVKEQALKEKELQLKFDLERFKIESGFRVNDESNDSTNACSVTSNLNFKKLIPDFDPKQSDISLVIFERQAKRASIEKKDWVGQLLGLLPLEIVQFIAREPEEQAENYDYVKKLLLKRFKLSPEDFRQKFVQHQKKSDSTWKDFTFEITNYLDEWLIGLEINIFQDLKDLMVVDQVKKRTNASTKDHFLDNWANLKSATQVAELFDNYEDVRKVNSKPMDRWGRNDKILTYSGVKEKENRYGKTSPRLGASVPESTRERTFEKRVMQRCYHCNMPGHIKAVCSKLIKHKKTETLNNIEGNENPDFLNSYTTKGSVNGHEIDILRDTRERQ
ncbi:CCHC-type domain-containing protein [Trichonephila clavipes]|uniref:CCHC-type domain-containing protein n=1 Tax=Trichonephila clavipes TaxID=2585209 RepID=A0A8X7BEZ0_TRICX|nr:CCHC-type domain-containing protein [Trichonephila clavipes]